jgi:hypothetical protein
LYVTLATLTAAATITRVSIAIYPGLGLAADLAFALAPTAIALVAVGADYAISASRIVAALPANGITLAAADPALGTAAITTACRATSCSRPQFPPL